MQKGNAAALIHMAKVKLGWSEKLKVEHASGSRDDAARRYLAMPEAERLAQLRVLVSTAHQALPQTWKKGLNPSLTDNFPDRGGS